MAIETLDVTIDRVIYCEPSKFSEAGVNYVIAKGHDVNGTQFTLKGEMLEVIPNESYRFFGESSDFGRDNEKVFKFGSSHVILPTSSKGALEYLHRYIKNIGPVRSKKIIDSLGDNAIDLLIKNPELIHSIKGLGKASASVFEHFTSPEIHASHAIAELMILFDGFEVPQRIIESLAENFGSGVVAHLGKNPYVLTDYPRLGWVKVDAIAQKCFGVGVKSRCRVVAAIREVLTKQSEIGHTCCGYDVIESEFFRLVSCRPEVEWIDWAIDAGLVVLHKDDSKDMYQLTNHWEAEASIARDLKRIMDAARPIDIDESMLDGLEAEQLEAVNLFSSRGVAILAGIPGSGKTHTVAKWIFSMDSNPTFVAPTGRAAKRLKELLDRHKPGNELTCSTIHKALGWVLSDEPAGIPASESKRSRGRSRFRVVEAPEYLSGDIFVVEESSMCDIFMAAALLKKIPSGGRLVIVGDPYQLPSIRAGSFLRDLLAAGVPATKLEKPRRNAGKIVEACWMIKNGDVPTPCERFNLDVEPKENWIHLEQSDPQAISDIIVGLHKKTKMDPFWDIQVISPQKEKGPIGCNQLNKSLSLLLNSKQSGVMGDLTRADFPFFLNDKVIRTRNGIVDCLYPVNKNELNRETVNFDGYDYILSETGVVNGDMGIVRGSLSVDKTWFIVVDLKNPDRLCLVPLAKHHLAQAYAVTTHKFQGSSAKCVIVPLSHDFYWNQKDGTGLFSRELAYTMFSRAEDKLITVGNLSALREAVKRKTIDHRNTKLRDFVAAEFCDSVEAVSV